MASASLKWRVLVLLAAVLSLSVAKPTITLRLNKTVCLSPCTVDATVRIEPHEWNRWFVVQINELGDDIAIQSSTKPLHPGDPPTQPPISFGHLGDGNYVVIAILYRQTVPSEAGRVWQQFCVGDGC